MALIIRNNLLKKTKDDFDKKTNQVRLTYKNRNNTWNSLKHFWLYIIKYKNLADNYLKDREGNNPVFQEMKQKHDLIYVKFTEPFNQKGGANVSQFNRQAGLTYDREGDMAPPVPPWKTSPIVKDAVENFKNHRDELYLYMWRVFLKLCPDNYKLTGKELNNYESS